MFWPCLACGFPLCQTFLGEQCCLPFRPLPCCAALSAYKFDGARCHSTMFTLDLCRLYPPSPAPLCCCRSGEFETQRFPTRSNRKIGRSSLRWTLAITVDSVHCCKGRNVKQSPAKRHFSCRYSTLEGYWCKNIERSLFTILHVHRTNTTDTRRQRQVQPPAHSIKSESGTTTIRTLGRNCTLRRMEDNKLHKHEGQRCFDRGRIGQLGMPPHQRTQAEMPQYELRGHHQVEITIKSPLSPPTCSSCLRWWLAMCLNPHSGQQLRGLTSTPANSPSEDKSGGQLVYTVEPTQMHVSGDQNHPVIERVGCRSGRRDGHTAYL